MKCLPVITASLLLGFGSTLHAQEVNSDELLGAVVGGVIGSNIGSGSGREIATVVGALIGFDAVRDRNAAHEIQCRKMIPPEYSKNRGTRKAWIRGCTAKLEQEQRDLEQQAYEDALQR